MPQQLTLPDGRILEYQISGAEDGFPLIWHHGTPGAVTPLPNLVTVCKEKGLKFITLSRSGYGGSSRHKGRRVVDCVADTKSLQNHLGIEKCYIGGWSGGGPHALACAARLPGCIAALCGAGVAPYDAEGLDWLEGQGEDNVEETKMSLKGEDELRKFCEAQRSDLMGVDVAAIVEGLSTVLPEVDKKALLETPWMGKFMVDSFTDGLKPGCDGWIDDDLEFIEPWGFELSEIKVPVLLYQGTEDKMVPFGHGKWLAEHLPQDQVRKHLLEGEGHISIFVDLMDKMVDDLLEAGSSA